MTAMNNMKRALVVQSNFTESNSVEEVANWLILPDRARNNTQSFDPSHRNAHSQTRSLRDDDITDNVYTSSESSVPWTYCL